MKLTLAPHSHALARWYLQLLQGQHGGAGRYETVADRVLGLARIAIERQDRRREYQRDFARRRYGKGAKRG